MKITYKIKSIKAAIRNIWNEHYFVFDPGTPSSKKEYSKDTEDNA